MKREKGRFLSLTVLLIAIAMIAAACGGGTEGAAGGTSGQGQEAGNSSDQPAAEAKVIRLSHNMPPDSAVDQAANKFKELVESRSNGALKVEVFGNSVLGSMREQTESVQFGSAEMTIQPISTMTPFVSDVQIVDYPFLWPNNEVLWKVLDDEPGQMMLDSMSEAGFKGLGFWAGGFKSITANKPIQTPQDLQGVKMRVIPSPLLIAQYEAYGANPVPVDFAELYNSLQQGVVDAQENPLETIYLQKYYEVQSHLSVANQGYLAYISAMNKAFFDGLSPELQQVVVEAEKEARELERKLAIDAEADYLKKLEEAGMQVVKLTDEQKAAFKELSLPVHQEFSKTDRQKQILEAIYKAVEEAQK
ncbi:TRAP transporter substrate-binding protein [Brevibacillus humidisoli]|uniref:TRAP transporter substrate-binding protein n=1 Tax=Brevibacillus humidisoli TaxID=2895522 RepID=UPI001E4DCFC8|nr:TRAP transporter substrate-binding protein [Brevibacillus humidisoli]UFJ41787.1 TRAP transporter substrate-binding protein [Brevibacillus humidisoli]